MFAAFLDEFAQSHTFVLCQACADGESRPLRVGRTGPNVIVYYPHLEFINDDRGALPLFRQLCEEFVDEVRQITHSNTKAMRGQLFFKFLRQKNDDGIMGLRWRCSMYPVSRPPVTRGVAFSHALKGKNSDERKRNKATLAGILKPAPKGLVFELSDHLQKAHLAFHKNAFHSTQPPSVAATFFDAVKRKEPPQSEKESTPASKHLRRGSTAPGAIVVDDGHDGTSSSSSSSSAAHSRQAYALPDSKDSFAVAEHPTTEVVEMDSSGESQSFSSDEHAAAPRQPVSAQRGGSSSSSSSAGLRGRGGFSSSSSSAGQRGRGGSASSSAGQRGRGRGRGGCASSSSAGQRGRGGSSSSSRRVVKPVSFYGCD
jgi:hypothetical protein